LSVSLNLRGGGFAPRHLSRSASLGKFIMTRLFSILFLAFAYTFVGLPNYYAQDSKIPSGWKKVSVCQINFLMPKNLKNQNVKGVDSCVVHFKSGKMRLSIDYGYYGGTYKNDGRVVGFKERFTEIDGKKAQLVTYKYTLNDKKSITGLYVLIYEAQDGMKTSLTMTIEAKSEKEMETAQQIFQSLRFSEF